MAILTRQEILKELKKGRIKITPLKVKNIGPCSVDLTLGDKFRKFKRVRGVHDVDKTADYTKITRSIEAGSVVIRPGETILGITREKITLPANICGWLEGRSSIARLGLMVHISASLMQPGIDNHQVLEMTNLGSVPLRLHAGVSICQFIFEKTIGKARYTGRFSRQTKP
ncbi:MAG: dCTP deaminase [bacterium]